MTKQQEEIVLGTMTLYPDSIPEIRSKLSVDDFTSAGRVAYFESAIKLYDQSGTCDVVEMATRMDEEGVIESQLEPADPVQFEKNVISPHETLTLHLPRLKKESASQKLQQEMKVIQSNPGDPEEMIKEIEGTTDDLKKALTDDEDVQNVADLSDDVVEKIERAKDGQTIGMSTGIQKLDETIGGLKKGKVVVIAGRPSMGKTSLARNISSEVVREGNSVLFVSLEMTASELSTNFLCSWNGISPWRAQKGDVDRDKIEQIHQNVPQYAENIDIIFPEKNSIEDIATKAEVMHDKNGGYDLVIVDHIQLLDSSNGDSRNERVGDVSRKMKQMAMRMENCVMPISQLNRQVERRDPPRPKLSDLRDSGSIEQDADVVVMLYRPHYYDTEEEQGYAEALVLKHRGGPTGTVELSWDPQLMQFGDYIPTGANLK